MAEWITHTLRRLGLPAFLMALACQLALVAADLPDQSVVRAAPALASAGVICHSAAPGEAPAPRHTHPAVADCGVWFAAHPGVLPAAVPAVPAPTLLVSWRGQLAQARAPPLPAVDAAYPRGPPSLV